LRVDKAEEIFEKLGYNIPPRKLKHLRELKELLNPPRISTSIGGGSSVEVVALSPTSSTKESNPSVKDNRCLRTVSSLAL